MVRVSIVTVVKDHMHGLIETHLSILSQTFSDWEMIIVVGASKDSTLLVAKDLETIDSRVKVLKQSDTGIYSAMNEGIESVGGEFIWFMNAGDKFATRLVLADAIKEISEASVGLVVGGYQIDKGRTEQVYVYGSRVLTALSFAFNRHGGCHQAMIFRTELVREIGGFDLSYLLASDFDLVLKVIKLASAVRVPKIYASIEPGGAADQGIFSVHRQKHQIRKRYFGNSPIIFLSSVWTIAARTKITFRRLLDPLKQFFT